MPNFNLNTEQGRAEWLAERRRHVMSTDLACILKLAPWRDATPLHVYLEKLGEYQRPDSKLKAWGRRLEDMVAAAYQEETGFAVEPADETMSVHPVHTCLAASMERVVRVGGQRRHLELKTVSEMPRFPWGEPGTDGVPNYYNLQAQAAMACGGFEAADFGVLFAGHEFRHYTVKRDERVIKAILFTAQDFWQRVQDRTPPEIDYDNPEARKLLHLVYPLETGKEVALGGDSVGLVEVYENARAAERTAREQKEKARAALLDRMGTASLATCGGRQLIRAIRHKEPYQVRGQSYVELTVRKPKPGAEPEYYVEGRESA